MIFLNVDGASAPFLFSFKSQLLCLHVTAEKEDKNAPLLFLEVTEEGTEFTVPVTGDTYFQHTIMEVI